MQSLIITYKSMSSKNDSTQNTDFKYILPESIKLADINGLAKLEPHLLSEFGLNITALQLNKISTTTTIKADYLAIDYSRVIKEGGLNADLPPLTYTRQNSCPSEVLAANPIELPALPKAKAPPPEVDAPPKAPEIGTHVEVRAETPSALHIENSAKTKLEHLTNIAAVPLSALGIISAGNSLYEQLQENGLTEERHETFKSAADLANASAQFAVSARVLSNPASKAPYVGMIIDSATEVLEGWVDEDKAMEKGNGYAAYLARNSGYFKASVKAGTGAGVASATAFTGNPWVVAGGFAIGLCINPALKEITEPCVELLCKDPVEPARLQGIADGVNAKAAAKLLAEATELMTEEKAQAVEKAAAYHLGHDTVGAIRNYTHNFTLACMDIKADKRAGRIIDTASVRESLEKAHESYISTAKAAVTWPLAVEDGERSVRLLRQATKLQYFLEGRPVLANTPASERRAEIMATLKAAKTKLEPAAAVYQISTKLKKDLETERLNSQPAIRMPGMFVVDEKASLLWPNTPQCNNEGKGLIAHIVSNAEMWNKVSTGDKTIAREIIGSVSKSDGKFVAPDSQIDKELYEKADSLVNGPLFKYNPLRIELTDGLHTQPASGLPESVIRVKPKMGK